MAKISEVTLNKIILYYKKGYYTDKQIAAFVAVGAITAAKYKEITGKAYSA